MKVFDKRGQNTHLIKSKERQACLSKSKISHGLLVSHLLPVLLHEAHSELSTQNVFLYKCNKN